MKKTIALFSIFALYLSLGCSHAGPIDSELKSYRCLAPDWSKTSGGLSPALSPDGKTLVYIAGEEDFKNDQIWVLSTEETYNPDDWYGRVRPKQQETWQIKCGEQPVSEEQNSIVVSGYSAWNRNVDWSPNGKSVAFICHGKLYIAEDINHETKSAKVRLLADVVMVPEELLAGKNLPAKKYAEPVLVPRWSPDGKKIAFYRPIPPSILGSRGSQVCVIDLETGKETVLTKGAVTDQPWSPDSKSLLYSMGIVSLTGGTPPTVINNVLVPSWSPKSDRLAYTGQRSIPGISTVPSAIYTCDLDGKNVKPIAKTIPSAAAIAAAKVQVRSNLIRVLNSKYIGIFSAAQIKEKIKAGVDDGAVYSLIQLAEGMKRAKEIGGDFKKSVDLAFKQSGMNANIQETIFALPWEKSSQLGRDSGSISSEISRPITNLVMNDRDPIWSPDGKRIAFWRTMGINGKMRLIVADMATNKSMAVFESDGAGTLSWTADGNSLVLSARRTVAYKEAYYYTKMKWTYSLKVPSYPEIWILDLK